MKKSALLFAVATSAILAGAASAQDAPLSHVVNNAALEALSTATASAVIRDGYATAGDAPAMLYTASSSACTLNSGAGDGGFQVASADGKCWLISPASTYDVREWGMTTSDGSGTTNGPALTNIAADTGNHTFFIPANSTFTIPCTTAYTWASSISLIGAGASSQLALPSSCASYSLNALFKLTNQSGVTFSNFSINLNGPSVTGTSHYVISANATSGTTTGLNINNLFIYSGNETIPTSGSLDIIGVAASNTATYAGVDISDNYFNMSPSTNDNQCVLLTTVNTNPPAGKIPSAKVNHNVCVGTAMQVDGAYTQLIGNDIAGWAFGAGLTFTGPNLGVSSNNYCLVEDNVIHDGSPNTIDINGTVSEGIENDCNYSLVQGNLIYNNGGQGIQNYADGARYIGNYVWDNGRNVGNTIQAGIVNYNLNIAGNHASNATFISNVAWDDGLNGSTQSYGFFEQAGHSYNTTYRANHFSGVVQAESIPSTDTISHDAGFIQTQSASAGASIAFTGLDTASYHRWRLSCHDVWPAAVGQMALEVGEGSSPTWETASSYQYTVSDSTTGALVTSSGGSKPAMVLGLNNWNGSHNAPGNFVVNLGDLSQTYGAKYFSFTGSYENSAGGLGAIVGEGSWLGDTGAITAIRLVNLAGANFNGACTLEGYVQ